MVSRIVGMKSQFNLFVPDCVILLIQPFMVYTAVYQQQETFCIIGTVSLLWGHIG